MLNKIFLIGALLVPVLAYGGSPGPDLSVQIVPAGSTTPPPPPPSNGVACDIEPNYTGSIPAAAQAAGYTHCAANYDFTNTSTFNNGAGRSGYNFSNLSTWLDCPDDGSAGWLWYFNKSSSTLPPCSDVNMINDGGEQVLDLTITPTDFNNNVSATQLTSQSDLGEPNTNGTGFPSGALYEVVARVPASSRASLAPDYASSGGGVIAGAAWEIGTNNAYAGLNNMEWDFIEWYAQSVNSGSTNMGEHCQGGATGCWGLDTGYNNVSSFDYTSYNTYWSLQTQDTSGHAAQCAYLNGTAVTNPCYSATYAGGASDPVVGQKNDLILWSSAQLPNIANECGQGYYCQTPTSNVDIYFKRLTVFVPPSCNWQTTTNGCAIGSIITTPP